MRAKRGMRFVGSSGTVDVIINADERELFQKIVTIFPEVEQYLGK